MKGVKFSYLYRDAGNSKAWGEIVFSNKDGLSITEIDSRLRKAFDVDGIFTAHQVYIPEVFLYADGSVTEQDHCFHEFSSVEETDEPSNDERMRSIREFVELVESESQRGWVAFSPAERVAFGRKV